MADGLTTLAGLVTLNDQNALHLGITDLLDDAPALQVLNAVPASNGTNHKYEKIEAAAGASFRAVGEGRLMTDPDVALITDTLKILDASFNADLALADGHNEGRAAYLAIRLREALRSAFFSLEQQIFQGTNNDSSGFVGLQDHANYDALADSQVVGLGGTTADEQTSAWLIRSDDMGISVVAGNEGNVSFSEDPTVQEKVVNPGTDNKVYPALFVAVSGYFGLQMSSKYSAVRVCNIHASDSGAALTDDDLYAGLAEFPAGKQPNGIFMNRAALKMLRDSRTATNVTGAPAPRPTDVEGIPITVTDGIVSTEAVEV